MITIFQHGRSSVVVQFSTSQLGMQQNLIEFHAMGINTDSTTRKFHDISALPLMNVPAFKPGDSRDDVSSMFD
ncbi:hypothetical protein RvY_11392 [Ramazzottius varieornatus]|uniref:Uncharacterized protein n=1 Tax=Ramazzottius varieornatus TaxID=947166 RepID=A0A1D1VFZ8_RAMVA|nr:hypothetical protein RvY_11392 [Ramazzottius varieornatus]